MARLPLLFASLALSASAALAGTEVTVVADQARMISIPGQAGTVVVGNPNIADVTLQGQSAFIHGRNYGTTNVIFLDVEGNNIAELDVLVTNGGMREVNIFRAGSRFSYKCDSTCESAVQIGDNPDYFKAVAEQNTTKNGLATGSAKTSE